VNFVSDEVFGCVSGRGFGGVSCVVVLICVFLYFGCVCRDRT